MPGGLHASADATNVMAGYIYLDLITGEQPDARRAEPLLSMLLRATAPA